MTLVDLEALGRDLAAGPAAASTSTGARAIVAQEVADYLTARRAETRRADRGRAPRAGPRRSSRPSWPGSPAGCPTSTPRSAPRSSGAVHRVVEKLLHTPTVRVKQLADEPGGDAYADALRALFDLDDDVFAVPRDRAAALTSPQTFTAGGAA